ncbi:hypothetical protein ACJJTC_018710 [Scirpophaga incertulas]
MGNNSTKNIKREPTKFFEREKLKEQKRDEKRKKKLSAVNRRKPVRDAPLQSVPMPPSSSLSAPPPTTSNLRSFDDEVLELMRYQLRNDSDAFLLNNILLSVQFFENYERDVENIKNKPISDREQTINAAMVNHNKHVFFADRIQECVNEHIGFQKVRGQLETLTSPKLFVIYDNVEASEPGDTSDYSAVLDAPFYKLCIEDSKEPGFVTLKKLEVLESTLVKDNDLFVEKKIDSDDSIYTDSEKESICSDDFKSTTKGEALLNKLKNRLNATVSQSYVNNNNVGIAYKEKENCGRRSSGPTKQYSIQVMKSNISKIKEINKGNLILKEEVNLSEHIYDKNEDKIEIEGSDKPRKSILKYPRRLSGTTKDIKSKQNQVEIRTTSIDSSIAEDTETSGYRSNSSKNEMSESESDYGYSTLKEAATPKKVEMSSKASCPLSTGALPEESWISIQERSVEWSDEEEQNDYSSTKISNSPNLYIINQFLSSTEFMNYFVDNFITKLGTVLGLSHESISNSMTQGASVYCEVFRNGQKIGNEVFPALIAAWPNKADQWIIRERKIIQNPRTNFSYQWPTKYMVKKAIGFGCLLIPIGYRPKRGLNKNQNLQWKVIFPAAERYLESCLAHAHMRCYLFSLILHKTYLENVVSKIGIDASHLKNHLFWQCEDNYAKWPEHRLGESLRMFLRSFYVHFGQGRFPNYFIANCNDFKSIPQPLLLTLQRKLANILESPVMHILGALDKVKYVKKDFYPTFNVHRLYEILTSKNPLRILNPNLPVPVSNNHTAISDSDGETSNTNFWEKAKRNDKNYQWKKEKQRQLQERRKVQFYNRKKSIQQEKEINTTIMLPSKLEPERRRLVLEFFIPHFIAMARSSEKFDAIRQAVIYLEQAQRLCVLLKEEPSGEVNANDYLDVIRDKLADCQRKMVTQGGYKLPPRRESNTDKIPKPVPKFRPRYEHISSQDSSNDASGFSALTFVDVHVDNALTQEVVKLNDFDIEDEDSKL